MQISVHGNILLTRKRKPQDGSGGYLAEGDGPELARVGVDRGGADCLRGRET
jgi:hypothetical protein